MLDEILSKSKIQDQTLIEIRLTKGITYLINQLLKIACIRSRSLEPNTARPSRLAECLWVDVRNQVWEYLLLETATRIHFHGQREPTTLIFLRTSLQILWSFIPKYGADS